MPPEAASAPETARPPRRKSSMLLSVRIFAGVLVFGVVLFFCVWFYLKLELNSQLASLRSQGLPTTLDELDKFYVVPQGVPDTTSLWVNAIDAVRSANLRQRGGT